MPSGSHRTSGGSHSSGGSSRSSGSFGGGSSRGRGPRGGMHHRGFRGGVYINGNQMGPVGSIIFFVVFLILFSGLWLAGGFVIGATRKANLRKVEQDYIYYQDMIEFAETQRDTYGNNSYIITGTITGKFLSEYEDKWYLEYSFESSYGYSTYYGETYAIYDYKDIIEIIPYVTTIELAADSPIITSTTDTVNMDYKNTTLEDDGYYLHTKKDMIFPQILCFVVGFGSAALFIYLISKEVKRLKGGSSEQVSPEAMPSEPQVTQPKTSFCAYCGSQLAPGKKKCPSCGAKN